MGLDLGRRECRAGWTWGQLGATQGGFWGVQGEPRRAGWGAHGVPCRAFIISESDRGLPCPAECPQERQRPVCASDGKLYKSRCAFQRARCREPLLEALPRARCEDMNLTRCQEDRAAALAQPQRQADSIYAPECDEDGSFLQVQCHKQTGYCWCATAEGKPISGTSVLNQMPNCTGKWYWSGRVKIGSLPPKEGSAPCSPPKLLSNPAEFPLSCEQERLEALEEVRQHQQEGTFIPECEDDGTYKPVQCHQTTGYCWCTRADSGRPIPGTSTRSVSTSCDSPTRPHFLPSFPGCPGPKKMEFLSTLMKALMSDMTQSQMMPLTYRRLPDHAPGPSLEEQVARWHFMRLDKDFSDRLSERELRPLKLYLRQHVRPKRCVRKFVEYCDLDADRLISLHELKGCLGLTGKR
uniref:SPARC related modular calcium binding 2 n=1 Tax=Pelusios castaneus TaxID=367368 RepID=A0A8C8VIE8_9SAUR